MQIIEMKISEVKPYSNNPRKITEEAIQKVAASIREFGFKQPIIIDKNNVIIAGHTRLKAAELLGLETVPVIRADDLTPEQVKAYRLADNKVAEATDWDMNALDKELAEILDIDMDEFGFDIADIDPDAFDDDFTLPDGDKDGATMTFTLANEQADYIKAAIDKVIKESNVIDDEIKNFGNTNRNGNALYRLVKEWAELRK